MVGTLVGYARCSTDEQDLTAQRQRLAELGVDADRIYLDHGLIGTKRARPRSGTRRGATWRHPGGPEIGSVGPLGAGRSRHRRLTRRARHRPLAGRAVLRSGRPDGDNILSTFAEFEVDLLRMRTREGMAVARAKGKFRRKQPKRSPKQQAALRRMHASGDYSITNLTELCSVSRPTVYRTLRRDSRSVDTP
jgi:DNA invertase Pin-like site-specific DNA recombinase